MSETKIEELRKEARLLEAKAREIEERERDAVQRPILRKSVGKCFKFSNSYGGDYPRWPMYARVVSFDEKEMTFETVEFQHTSRQIIEISYERRHNYNGRDWFAEEGTGWEHISASEYERARKATLRFVVKLIGR